MYLINQFNHTGGQLQSQACIRKCNFELNLYLLSASSSAWCNHCSTWQLVSSWLFWTHHWGSSTWKPVLTQLHWLITSKIVYSCAEYIIPCISAAQMVYVMNKNKCVPNWIIPNFFPYFLPFCIPLHFFAILLSHYIFNAYYYLLYSLK